MIKLGLRAWAGAGVCTDNFLIGSQILGHLASSHMHSFSSCTSCTDLPLTQTCSSLSQLPAGVICA